MLALSLREALELRDDHIGPEHILLGMLREGGGVAARILVERGMQLGWLRQQVLRAVGKVA